jgi:hypothetical protein
MIHETVIDKAMNRLMEHFGDNLVLRPPASAADLARLEALVGPLPRDYSFLLTTCNGLRIGRAHGGDELHLRSVQEALDVCGQPQVPAIPAGFVPLATQADGRTDWLVLADLPLHGAVLRWAPGEHGEEIVASSFGHYFDNWARYLTATFDRRGRRAAGRKAPAFNGAYCAKSDAGIALLRRSREAGTMMAELELRASAGEDFE